MTEIAAWAGRTTLGSALWGERAIWIDRARWGSRAVEFAVWLSARAAAEARSLVSSSPAGAFHGEQPPDDGRLTMARITWGRP